MSNSYYEQYVQHVQKLADIENSIGVLIWDKEVYLPQNGATFRSQQIATLSGILHEESTKPDFVETVRQLKESPNGLSAEEQRNIEVSWRDLQRVMRLDTAFVKRRAQLISEAFHAWMKAREANDYRHFGEALAKLVDTKREEAELLGYEDHPYDALLEEFEPGSRVAKLDALFRHVRQNLVQFVRDLDRQLAETDDRFLHLNYPRDTQWKFGIHLLENLGYDFESGRQDIAPHPFTINFSPEDVRVTTRIDEQDLANMTWSCIHEAGHAMYEQGLPKEPYGLPISRAASLSIHESQARLWENHVGRSLTFWKAKYPLLQRYFPAQLRHVSLGQFYQAINKVTPNLIRTEADELHYHFHVMVRYELEKGLMDGSLEAKDLVSHWNDMYRDYLGVEVPNDRQGILQDIHWAHGSFGYFPTYSLGSFYAAQFFRKAKADHPELEDEMARGNLKPLKEWLQENIYDRGKRFEAEELCEKVTGEPLRFSYFMDYAREKYQGLLEMEDTTGVGSESGMI